MLIIGCDYHPSFQQIAYVNTEGGELGERRLVHPEEAEQFYGELKQRNLAVRVGMEASGHARWFERVLRQLEFELWIGDAAEIRTKRVRKQKTDRQDAQLLLRLMMEDRFPRIWVPDAENRDLRQLLWHRHRLVQMRTRVMNQLHVVALNEGLQRKKGTVAAGRSERTGIASAGALGQSPTSGPVGVTRPTHAADPEVDASPRSGSGEASGGTAAEDPSRSRAADSASVRVGDWNTGPISLRKADRQLCGVGS
jgi:transposase